MKLPRIQLSRYLGCMVGGAAGDALGRVTEGLSRQQIRAKYGQVTEYQPQITRKGTIPPGTFTDDTHMMLLTAESLIGQNRVDIDHLTSGYIAALHQNLGIAGTTRRALELREEGNGIEVLAHGRHAGAGAATRMLPLALYEPFDLTSLENEAEAVARITHVDEDAVTGAVAIAFSIAWAVRGELQPSKLVAGLRGLADQRESNLSYTLAHMEDLLSKNVGVEEGLEEIGNDGAAVRLIPSALFSFLKTPNGFYSTIVAAVNAGGDADTRAAIAGGLSGAYVGLTNISPHFIRKLDQSSRIQDAAHSIFQLASLREGY